MKVLYHCLISLFLMACETNEQKKYNPSSLSKIKNKKEVFRPADLVKSIRRKTLKKDTLNTSYQFNRKRKFDLTIEKKVLKQYSNTILTNTKSIAFIRVDTIDYELKLFKNIEHILIRGYQKTYINLNQFPKLKTITVFQNRLTFSKNTNFSNIEAIWIEKSIIKGINSLSQLKSLKYINIKFSKLTNTEINFNNLTLLEYLNITAFKGELNTNLRLYDINNTPRLKHLNITDEFGKIIGIPLNISKRIWSYFYIYNRNIDIKEKEILKKLNLKNNKI